MQHEIRMFSKEEIDRMVRACCYKETRDVIRILEESGCRVCEVLNLKAGDIRFSDGWAVMSVDGKTGPRTVPVKETAAILQEYMKGRGPEERMFRHPYVTHYQRMRVLTERLGIVRGKKLRVLFHGIRHYAATKYIRAGIPDQVIRKMFGWTPDSQMFNVYSHIDCHDVQKCLMAANGPMGIPAQATAVQPVFLWVSLAN